MIRRRRRVREIPFSFDSFLDIVANVVGVIIRLILVVWVGARSYSSLQTGIKPIPRAGPVNRMKVAVLPTVIIVLAPCAIASSRNPMRATAKQTTPARYDEARSADARTGRVSPRVPRISSSIQLLRQLSA